ncbi:MAG: hypothetical protein GY822_30325, partial [Deltaproteobacteria bacterium]|nr:hypothetical protein [Deltaproteobacteria bacterium]
AGDADGSPADEELAAGDADGSPAAGDADGSPAAGDADGSPAAGDADGSPAAGDADGSPADTDDEASGDADGSPADEDEYPKVGDADVSPAIPGNGLGGSEDAKLSDDPADDVAKDNMSMECAMANDPDDDGLIHFVLVVSDSVDVHADAALAAALQGAGGALPLDLQVDVAALFSERLLEKLEDFADAPTGWVVLEISSAELQNAIGIEVAPILARVKTSVKKPKLDSVAPRR